MCGISGIVYNNTQKQTQKFKTSADLQAHRGPDYTGYYGDEFVDLMHHRLSIIDLDQRANQPFFNEDKTKLLVYNGEIYNYKDLSTKYGLQLKTTSDTEVLSRVLDIDDFNIAELNGIFAFAQYDIQNQKLHLYRDRLGVKPLYYYKDEHCFLFASEAKVIYNYLDQLEINYQALSEFLTFGHSNGDQTLISGVKKLTPGTMLTLSFDSFRISKKAFWSAETLVNRQIKPTYAAAKSHAFTLLKQAIQRQCMSDVPIGAYLSGGIDSSAIVALASQDAGQKLMTYSVDFDNSPNSELKAAAKLAKQFGTEHYEFQVSTTAADEYLAELIYQYDEPFADPAMIPLHLIAKKASTSAKVILQGDGGDEVFAGYGKHLDVKQYQLRKLGFYLMKNFGRNQKSKDFFAKRYKRLNHRSKAEVMAYMVESDEFSNLEPYFAESFLPYLKDVSPIKGYHESHARFKELPFMQNMLYTDMENILRHKYLEKVDKINMYHSIEARVPLLDNELVDYVMRLPQSYKIKKNVTKYFLRDMLQGIVPNDILNDRKRSFGTPFPDWTVSRLYTYAIHHFEKGKKIGLPFNFDLLTKELNKINSGEKDNNATLIWKFLVLTIWLSFYQNKLVGLGNES